MQLSPKRQAHLYALMAWNDKYTLEEATNLVSATPYEKLDEITYAETSIVSATEGIKKYILSNKEVELDKTTKTLTPNDKVYDLAVKAIVDIHNKWVVENAKKYDRGNEVKSDKNLFQHLPTALIGIDEVAKDLMFLAPILSKLGVDVGEMELTAYGAFKPNEQFTNAYNRYVERYNNKHQIKTYKDLANHIVECIEGGYSSLKPINEKGEERLAYMKNRVQLLTDTVIAKNEEKFGKLTDLNV